jgi:hypothetical protein
VTCHRCGFVCHNSLNGRGPVCPALCEECVVVEWCPHCMARPKPSPCPRCKQDQCERLLCDECLDALTERSAGGAR